MIGISSSAVMGRRGLHAARWLSPMLLCRVGLVVLLLVTTVLPGVQVAAAELSVAGVWANATVAAIAGLRLSVTTGPDSSVPADATFAFRLHHAFAVSSDANVDAAALSLAVDGSWNVSVVPASNSDNVLTVARNSDGLPVPAATTMVFSLTGVQNPSRAGVFALGTLAVTDMAGTWSVQVALPSVQIDPGVVWNAAFELESALSGRETAVTARLTPAHGLPVGGAVVVRFPDVYGALDDVSLALVEGLDGETTLSTEASRVIVSHVGGTGSALDAMRDVIVQLGGVVNPTFEGPVGRSVLLQTLDADGLVIDQAYVDVQSIVLSRAVVQVSTVSLAIAEGEEGEYSIWLSAPPNGSTVTVTPGINSADPSAAAIVVEPASMTFTATNWSQKAVVTVAALDDNVVIGSATQRKVFTISHSLVEAGSSSTTFAPPDDVVVRISEDDFPGVQLSRRFCAIIEGLRNDSYELRLLSRPSSSVRIDIASSSPTVQTLPSFIEISPDEWDNPQAVQVRPSEPSSLTAASKFALSHRVSSTDSNYNDSSDFVYPQDHVTVFYEPLEMESCIQPCRPGMFQLVDLTTSEVQCVGCPLGYYCPGDCSQPLPCPIGTASSSILASSMTDACAACPPGSYAHMEGLASCLICPAGASCASSTQLFEPCPVGTYADENQVACHRCPAGSYNNQTFQSQCMDCPAGYHCPAGSTSPEPCAGGSYSNASRASVCSPCPAGYECSASDQSILRPCQRGTFSLEADTACHACPPGFKCPDIGQPPQPCPAGGYNSHENATECASCPRGSACPSASSDPVVCALGSFSSMENAVACLQCPAGYSCADPALSPTQCASGQYSLEVRSAFVDDVQSRRWLLLCSLQRC